MDKLLTGKITFVADGTGTVGMDIVSSLLMAGATVIVPGRSAGKINQLKEKVAAIRSGNLVTFLTDFPDYEKAFDVVECIEEKYGQIDLAVIVFDSPKAFSTLASLTIDDWQQMMDENITACFVSAHVFLNSMKKRRHGMYISISNAIDPEKNKVSVLEEIAASTQVELASIFAAEAKGNGIQYHHLFIQQPTVVNEKGLINSALPGDLIISLFTAKVATERDLFQWLPANKILM